MVYFIKNKKNEMKKSNLLKTSTDASRLIKTGIALLFSIGAFISTTNAQNAERDNHADKRRDQVTRDNPRPQNRPQVTRERPTRQTTTVRSNTTVVRRPAPVNNNVNNNRTVARRTTTTYRRPVYNAHNPSWRYANVPRRNTVITVVPTGYRVVNYGGFAYRYYRGVYYRPYNNSFMVVAPPVGLFINVMPYGYRMITVNNLPYYYYNGTYYQYRNSNYYVVSPPVGAVVESLPQGYETLTIDGETYYTVDGAQYKPVIQDNGEIWYQVIKAN